MEKINEPKKMKAVILEGQGFENLKLKEVDVPEPNESQLLAKVDCTTICTSVLKLVSQGSDHPFLYGWDLKKKPIVPGDEGAVTVVRVGRKLEGKYNPGQKFAIQPAVDTAPINNREMYKDNAKGISKVAVGYTLQGHYAEYILITEETINAGCLIPVPSESIPSESVPSGISPSEDIPAFGVSLSEPVSCVVSSQDHHLHLVQENALSQRVAKKGLKKNGVTVVCGAGPMGRLHIELSLKYGPAKIISVDIDNNRLDWVMKKLSPKAKEKGIELICVNSAETDAVERIKSLTDNAMADDVIDATGNPESVKMSQQLVGRGGVLNLFGGMPKGSHVIPFDTTVIHYREVNITGSSGGGPVDTINTLNAIARHEIDPGLYVSVVGSIDCVIPFLGLVKDRKIEGKAVVYPHIRKTEPVFVDYWSKEREDAFILENSR